MSRKSRLTIALVVGDLGSSRWRGLRPSGAYPGGFGGCGWMGWGVGTAEGDIARGMGSFLMGAGFYNEATAVADSINTDTIMRWNEYVHEAQENLNRKRAQRKVQARERTNNLNESIQNRLSEAPELRDIFQGSALEHRPRRDQRSPGLRQGPSGREDQDRRRKDPDHSLPLQCRRTHAQPPPSCHRHLPAGPEHASVRGRARSPEGAGPGN